MTLVIVVGSPTGEIDTALSGEAAMILGSLLAMLFTGISATTGVHPLAHLNWRKSLT